MRIAEFRECSKLKGQGSRLTFKTSGPFFRKTKRGHYVAFGATGTGRYRVVIFEKKPKGIVRPITGWDMKGRSRRRVKITFETLSRSLSVSVRKGELR